MASTARGGDLGFENTLWEAADKLRGNMDAAEYKHVVLGLIFLKYISDALREADRAAGGGPGVRRRPDWSTRAERVFWVPEEARWDAIQAAAGDTRRSGGGSTTRWTRSSARTRR